jgi:hypothetical protein
MTDLGGEMAEIPDGATGFADGLDVGCKRKESKRNPGIFA